MSASRKDQVKVKVVEMNTQPGAPKRNNDAKSNMPNESSKLLDPASSGRNYVLPAPKLEVFQEQIEGAKRDIESSIAEEGDEEEEDSGHFLAILFVMYCVVALMNRLFQKLQTIPMYNYPLFLNLLTTFAYIPTSFAYIIPMQYFGSAITKEQTDIPKYKFGVMGTLDCLSSIMAMFAVNYIANASTIVLIQQSAIPISMAFSKLTLGAVYSGSQVREMPLVCFCKFVVILL
jgi:hypothetical protein